MTDDRCCTVRRALALALRTVAVAALAVAAPIHGVQAQPPVPAPHPTPTPANDGSIHAGVCRHGPCGVDSTKCDPDAWNRYNAKEKAVRGIISQWYAKEMSISEQEKEGFAEFVDEEYGSTLKEHMGINGLEITAKNAQRYFMDQAMKPYADLEQLSEKLKYAESVEEMAGPAALLFKTGELALYFEQIVNNADVASDENKKTLERADSLWQEALADLLQELSQNAACQKDRDAAVAKEKLHDQAEAMIQDWEYNPGRYRYNGVNYDFGAALKKAAEIIQSGRQSSMRPDSPRFEFAAYEPRAASDTIRGYWLTRDQIQAAIAELELAQTRTRNYFAALGEVLHWRPPAREQIGSLLAAQPDTAQNTGGRGSSVAGDVVDAAKNGAKQGATDNVRDAAHDAAKKAIKKVLRFP